MNTDKLTDREIAEQTLVELNNVNKKLVKVDKNLYLAMLMLAFITGALIFNTTT
jgi:hypothetical protein